MILFFTVDKQIITRRDNEKVVRDSQNYLYINFSFSEDWTGTKTAVFKGKSGNAFNVLIDENGSCLVPWEVLTEEYFEVSAFCGDLITANVVKVFTIESGYTIGEESRTPTPDIYAQIIARLSAIEAEIDPTAIQQVVDEYLSDKDYVTEQDVEQIVADYVEAHKDELKGEKGDTGATGPTGPQGPKGDTGEGVAPGGTTGQVLIKSSDADYDTEWGTVEGGSSQVSEMPTPSADNVGKIVQYVGETTYQYLNGEFYKCVNADGSYKWEVVNEEELLTIHSLLTETNPLTVYGATNSNENVWISTEAFVPKGSTGRLRVLGSGAGTSYKVMLLRKNSDTNFTILETFSHAQSVAKEITEFIVDATNESVYIGLYSNNGGIYYSTTQVTSKDYLVKNTLAEFNVGSGTADVTKASSRLNFSYALIVETTPIKGSVYYPFVVDASGHGDFVSIGDAINNTSEGDVIYIRSGIYKEQVKMWGENRHLLGESKLTTFLVSDSRLYNNEPLQANMGIIENLTIIGGYGLTPVYDETTASYAIHVENANATPFELLIKDCNIISNVAAAIGLGVRYNQKVTIQNCYIETKAEKMWSSVNSQYFDCGAVFGHNDASAPNLGTDAYLSVENCELKGVKTAITLNSQNNGNTLTFRFLHNTLWSTINGTENAVTIRATPTSGHLVGSDGVLDEISYGNNIDLLNATVILPIAPTTDGTYTLQATVADGVVTYSWI